MAATIIIDRSKCPAPRHGRYWMAAKYHCHCLDTRLEMSTRERGQRHGTIPIGYHDATGTRRRLQALNVEGWTRARLAELTGLTERTIHAALHERTHIQVATARAVAQVYERCAGHDGGSRTATIRAARHGWLDSYHWPDNIIDDPNARPWYGEPRQGESDSGHTEAAALRREAVARLTAAGAIAAEISAQLGIDTRSVQRHRQALRRQDTATDQAAA